MRIVRCFAAVSRLLAGVHFERLVRAKELALDACPGAPTRSIAVAHRLGMARADSSPTMSSSYAEIWMLTEPVLNPRGHGRLLTWG